MSEMVERVAQAICGDDNPANILAVHRSRARAAIEALREPTEEMLSAAESPAELFGQRFKWLSEDEARTVWNAMIDQALK